MKKACRVYAHTSVPDGSVKALGSWAGANLSLAEGRGTLRSVAFFDPRVRNEEVETTGVFRGQELLPRCPPHGKGREASVRTRKHMHKN